jgi:hypothetical protein
MNDKPKYHVGQMLRVLLPWAKGIAPRPVSRVTVAAPYEYAFPFSGMLIQESELEPTGEPDIDPSEWIQRWHATARNITRA